MGLNLRKFVLHIIGVHRANLLASGSAQHLDDFHQLVNSRFTGEEGLAQHQFRHHATSRPYIYQKNEPRVPNCGIRNGWGMINDVPILVV